MRVTNHLVWKSRRPDGRLATVILLRSPRWTEFCGRAEEVSFEYIIAQIGRQSKKLSLAENSARSARFRLLLFLAHNGGNIAWMVCGVD